MVVENLYWEARKTVERTVGGYMFEVGNRLALAGHERLAEPLIWRGSLMNMVGRISHRPFRIDPELLNEDGSFNREAWREKMTIIGDEQVRKQQAYFWTPEWQADEIAAEEDLAAGRFKTFSSTEEAIRYLAPDLADQVISDGQEPNPQ